MAEDERSTIIGGDSFSNSALNMLLAKTLQHLSLSLSFEVIFSILEILISERFSAGLHPFAPGTLPAAACSRLLAAGGFCSAC
jgi:hypothetical protein